MNISAICSSPWKLEFHAGFDLNKNKNGGTGLIHIKKRAELIGATYILKSSQELGTKLTLELPL